MWRLGRIWGKEDDSSQPRKSPVKYNGEWRKRIEWAEYKTKIADRVDSACAGLRYSCPSISTFIKPSPYQTNPSPPYLSLVMERTSSLSQHAEGVASSPNALEAGKPEAFHVEDRTAHLSEEHRQYLLARHGTLDLDPIPDMNDADPYNWPKWRVSISAYGGLRNRRCNTRLTMVIEQKTLNLSLVVFHAMIGLFTAASIQSAFVNISADLGVSMQRTSYLVSLFIAVLGGAPLFWRPLSNRFGRRPIFLISLLCAMIGNIGCAESHSYATMGLCRAITAFFISPAAAIGSAVVAETFFKKDRARCMGYWTLMVTLGVPVAPFRFGF